MKKPRTAPTPADRQAMIPHLEYEVSMLRGALVEFYARNRPNITDLLDRADPERIARTAFFEGVLLHARVLHEFLSPTEDGKRADDLWAGDFFKPGDWKHIGGPLDSVIHLRGQVLPRPAAELRRGRDGFQAPASWHGRVIAVRNFRRSITS